MMQLLSTTVRQQIFNTNEYKLMKNKTKQDNSKSSNSFKNNLHTHNKIKQEIHYYRFRHGSQQSSKGRNNTEKASWVQWCIYRNWVLQGKFFFIGQRWCEAIPGTAQVHNICTTKTIQKGAGKTTRTSNTGTTRSGWNSWMLQQLWHSTQPYWYSMPVSRACKTLPSIHKTSSQSTTN